ncbi:MAG: UbiX family flavin prenyltransferase [Methanobacteriota archaeon]
MGRLKIVVGVSGASGAPYALEFLRILKAGGHKASLIITASARQILDSEIEGGAGSLEALACETLVDSDVGDWPASGSRRFDALVVVPCSMSTLSKIAYGISDSLITRSAAVALKERRRLVVVPRETPLSLPMIEAMRQLTLAGGIVLPAMPAFYHKPKRIDDLVLFVAARIASSVGVEAKGAPEWNPPHNPRLPRKSPSKGKK